jgi:hypothetical protein
MCVDGYRALIDFLLHEFLGEQQEIVTNLSLEEEQRQALEDFFNAMGGKKWLAAKEWLEPDALLKDWMGVRQNSQHHLIAIELQENRLKVRPESLTPLHELRENRLKAREVPCSCAAASPTARRAPARARSTRRLQACSGGRGLND